MLATTVLAASLVLLAPVPAAPPATGPAIQQAEDKIPASLFLKEKPKDAKDLKAAKKIAKQGDKVVVAGRIGGRKAPFTDKRAVFTLVDPSLKACNEVHGDSCKTPWDFCCESKETMLECMGTVQIVGPDGKPLKVTAEGAGGLKPLAKLTVVGTVKSVGKDGEFSLVATGIHVE